MKNYLFVLLFGILISCNLNRNSSVDNKGTISQGSKDMIVSASFQKKTDSELIKNNMIRESLKKKGIYSYLSYDTVHVYDDKNTEIINVCLPSCGEISDCYRQLDTTYSIEQDKNNNRLFIKVRMPNTELDPSNFIIVDLMTKRVVLNIGANYSDSYIGSSSNGEYHLIESGTAACGRDVHIYNSNSTLVKQIGYNDCVKDKKQLQWEGNMFYYYDDCEKKVKLPNNLPPLKENEIYVQKHYWVNGKDSISNEFAIGGSE